MNLEAMRAVLDRIRQYDRLILFRHLRPDGDVVLVEPAFGEVVLAEGYWFAPDRLSDPAHRWLFARLDQLAVELERR